MKFFPLEFHLKLGNLHGSPRRRPNALHQLDRLLQNRPLPPASTIEGVLRRVDAKVLQRHGEAIRYLRSCYPGLQTSSAGES